MYDDQEKTEEYERCFQASLTPLKAYLTNSGASNHMIASRKYFITFPLLGGPSNHMRDDSKIPDVERGSDKIHHDYFMPSPTEKKIVEDEEEAYVSLQSIQIEESLLEVTPSLATP